MYVDPEATIDEKKEISAYLVESANEMDKVIRNITDITCKIAIKS